MQELAFNPKGKGTGGTGNGKGNYEKTDRPCFNWMTTGHCAYGGSCKYKHEEQQAVRMLTQDERAELTMWRRQFANQGKNYTNACRTWTLDGFHTGGSENKKLLSAQIVTEAIREMDSSSTPMKNSKHDVSKSMTLSRGFHTNGGQ